MMTVFLLWTILNGAPADVDAFWNESECLQTMTQINEEIKAYKEKNSDEYARKGSPKLVGCQPVTVVPPAVEEAPKQSS